MSFRLRLTFFGATLVALTVLAFGWLVYTLATNTQGTTQDDALRQRAADAQAAIAAVPASQLSAPGTLTGAEDLARRTDPFIEVLTSTGTVLSSSGRIGDAAPAVPASLLASAAEHGSALATVVLRRPS